MVKPWAGPFRDSHSVLGAECLALDGQRSVPEAQDSRPAPSPVLSGPSVLCNCTCNALEPTLGWSRPASPPAVWASSLSGSAAPWGVPGLTCVLLPPEALASWACTQSFWELCPSVGDMWAMVLTSHSSSSAWPALSTHLKRTGSHWCVQQRSALSLQGLSHARVRPIKMRWVPASLTWNPGGPQNTPVHTTTLAL